MRKIAIVAAAAALAGCGPAAAATNTGPAAARQPVSPATSAASQASSGAGPSGAASSPAASSCDSGNVGPTGQPLCGSIQHVVATTNHLVQDRALGATCKPTGVISDGAMDFILNIRYQNVYGAEPISIGEVQVFLLDDGDQEAPSYPNVTPAVTLNPGSSVTLSLSTPLTFAPGDSPVSCVLGAINFYSS